MKPTDDYFSLAGLVDTINVVRKNTAFSLPAITKPFMISSPVFIQESVFRSSETTLNNILSGIYDVYVGYILMALKLETSVGNGKVLSDRLAPVSTGFNTVSQYSNESLYYDPTSSHTNDYKEVDDLLKGFGATPAKKVKVSLAKEEQFLEEKSTKPLISGKMVQVEIISEDGRSRVPIVLFIQLTPRVFPDSIVGSIISTQIKPDIRTRYFQYKAGEISFMKDFILGLDRLKAQDDALRADKSNTIYDILTKRNAGFLKRLGKLAGIVQSSNFKDATFIFDKNSLARACSDAGISFDNYSSRQKFFDSTYSMFVLGVDENFGFVDFYIDAMPKPGKYSFSHLTTAAKKKDLDIVDIIKSLSSGSANVRSI